ncbi:MerR family transcriptional regulator [Streptomyces sp. VRA16 Mangrove soil]|uniref:MerR family transcriptional regulator n=1 Tax=Streptomyces sp. VRA16 Mangrove soil TaxID=2817434 RepID=UPI001A9D1D5F|nr:MerR family transcriptional regulator [Streptomyces sp. VRA16 Mangrove soil]MBO1336184.1 MerR family transcriptional regulator [Streptomyces sp. VRA16 Mangrove soil]
MRIGELARRTGVPVPTIKYYTREGLLPPGERSSPNQVAYDDEHVRRLKLIRAMLEVGGVSVAAARDVLAEVDSPHRTVHGALGVAQAAVSATMPERGAPEDRERAEAEVAELVRRHGWRTKPQNPGWRSLVQIVATYRDLDRGDLLVLLDRYATAAGELATAELAALADVASTDGKVEGVVLGTVLGDAAMAALRRIAQEDVSARLQRP